MTVRVGLMGFGRIGRNIFRALGERPDIEVVAIADVAAADSLAYLLKYDSVLGRYPGPVRLEGGRLHAGSRSAAVLQVAPGGAADFAAHGVQVVVEAAAGRPGRAALARHLGGPVRHVVGCGPLADAADATVVMGINDHVLTAEHAVIDVGTPAAHCALAVVAPLAGAFGIERLYVTAVHAYTNDQRLADVPGEDLRRSRAAAENIVPAPDLVGPTLEAVLPGLRGRVSGLALKVPVANGSLVDITAFTRDPVTVAQVNEALAAAAADAPQCIEYCQDPIVSSDVKLSPHSAVVDAQATMALGGHVFKSIAWFDNGWGFAHRTVALLARLGGLQGAA